MSVRAGKSESEWASPTWNWGSARGDAHDEALKIRTKLNAPQSRSTWLEQMVTTDSLVSWSEVKLVLALKWQRAAHARRDGGEAGYGYVMEQLRRAKYEGSVEADKKFVSDMEERLAVIVADADRSKLREFVEPMDGGQWMDAVKRESPTGYHRRSVAAQVLVALKFVDDGL
eukprot:CAMPEP_0198201992 /NCGR_PEP_ID=MMETSP1445-20131203/5038_1 /TAXON_ID=36898 /ORGANISM="Pyramimonas sp., Strain CCMP2087" /LENGTH=171 /DNA_ID=CAMNT_0043872685 /DNA_START=318 /DNA_END=833 /DNA_ORIENTATION=-